MTEWLDFFTIVAVVAMLGGALGAIAAGPASTALLFGTLAPRTRCRRAELLALLPLAGAVLGVTALLLPALLKLSGLIDDHCLEHGLHHPHFCFRHLPTFAPGVLSAALVLLATLPFARLVGCVLTGISDARVLTGIERMAGSQTVIRTELAVPCAYLFGLRRPRIVLSAGLIDVLTSSERRAVVRHEIAHARSGDPARRLALELLLTLHFGTVRNRLRHCWQQAAEERADDAVARQGQGLELAAALVKLLRQPCTCSLIEISALAADAGDVERRVRRLVEGGRDMPGSVWCERLLPLAGLLGLAVLAGTHHSLETLLGWL